ncbi:MAG: hypothetical protein DHS20C18_07290 [Saprospiraceae bacterium]|nr:MAG: hypothetical protein DHS20C18_07290 [Saprospiraceae bacterium]
MKKLIFLLLAISVLSSCRKDLDDTTIIEEHYNPPVIKVNGSLLGKVIDENGTPVAGATVRLGTNTVMTGEFGFFKFDNKVLNAAGTFVSVEMPGYFQGSDRFFPKANTLNYTTIQLLPKTIAGTINGTNGGEVNLSSGAIVRLPAGSIVDASGQPFTGDIQVAVQWLNPKANNLGDFMPGNLQGVSESSEVVSMVTYGMMAVELSSTSGEILNVAPGQKATLEFPIVSELSASALQEIPLWYFDETAGIWIEEGKAIRQGDRYIGEVGHFSFWNCDYFNPLVYINGTLVDPDGNPLNNVSVEITLLSNASVGWGYTNNNGDFGGQMPKDEPLLLQIRTDCGEIVISQNIGPFSEDTDIGTIIVDYNQADLIEVSGILVDCDGNPVDGGVIQIKWEESWSNGFAITEDDGSFSFIRRVCDEDSYTLIGIDLENQFQSEEITGTVPGTTDLGVISACAEELDEYIRVNYDGMQYEYLLPTQYADTITYISALSLDSTFAISFAFPGFTTGTFGFESSRFFYYDTENITGFHFSCGNGNCDDVDVNVTQYGAIGEKIIGSFEGNVQRYDYTQSIYTSAPILVSFKVDREY